MYVYCVYLAMSKSPKSKKDRNMCCFKTVFDGVLYDVRAFLPSINMNQNQKNYTDQ